MVSDPSGGPLDDIAYLVRSDHRIPTLVALKSRARSRSELWEMAGVSSSTIRRTLTEFEKRDWIRKDEYKYETTQLGEFVASAMVDLIDRADTEQQLRDVWQWLPDEDSGFTLEMCADATITIAEANNPYRPVNRFSSLLAETDHFRFVGLDVAMFEPCKDELAEQIQAGMQAEFINPPRVAKYIRNSCSELFSETLEAGDLTLHLHNNLPSYGVGLFDERVVVTGYDPDAVTVRVLIDTDDPEARDWAESIYHTYRRETPTIPLEQTEAESAPSGTKD